MACGRCRRHQTKYYIRNNKKSLPPTLTPLHTWWVPAEATVPRLNSQVLICTASAKIRPPNLAKRPLFAAMLAAASKLAAAAFQQANPQLPACAGRGILITIVSDTM